MAGALWLVFGFRQEPLRSLPMVQAFNAGRYLLFALFFLALLCGIGVRVINGKRRYTWALLALVFDLGPTTLQQPYLDASVYADARLSTLRRGLLILDLLLLAGAAWVSRFEGRK